MKTSLRLLEAALVAAAVTGAAGPGLRAQTLQDLASYGGTIFSGNLVFSDFTASTSGNVSFPPSSIPMVGSTSELSALAGDLDLVFSSGFGLSGNGYGAAQTYQLNFSFTVTDTDPQTAISGDTLFMGFPQAGEQGNPPSGATDDISILGVQTLTDAEGNLLGASFAEPVVKVTGQINMTAPAQQFGYLSEGPTEDIFPEVSVPEPGTLALLGVGALGLAMRRRQTAG